MAVVARSFIEVSTQLPIMAVVPAPLGPGIGLLALYGSQLVLLREISAGHWLSMLYDICCGRLAMDPISLHIPAIAFALPAVVARFWGEICYHVGSPRLGPVSPLSASSRDVLDYRFYVWCNLLC